MDLFWLRIDCGRENGVSSRELIERGWALPALGDPLLSARCCLGYTSQAF